VLLAILAVDLLRNQPPKARWVLLILSRWLVGVEATILPMAICGFGLVYLARICRGGARGPPSWRAVAARVFLGSLIVLSPASRGGLRIKLGELFVQLQPYASIRHGSGLDRPAQLLSAATTLLAWDLP